LALQTPDTSAKRLELLREVVPNLRRLAIMGNVGNPAPVLEMGETQAAAGKLGLAIWRQNNQTIPPRKAIRTRFCGAGVLGLVPHVLKVRTESDIAAAFMDLAQNMFIGIFGRDLGGVFVGSRFLPAHGQIFIPFMPLSAAVVVMSVPVPA
jgi:hypothetical protein